MAERLPDRPQLYIADTAYCPYGGRPLPEIRARALAVSTELVRRGAALVVVACNSATGAGVEEIRARLDVPVVAMEPAIKPAAQLTTTGRIAVMATQATIETERFKRLLREYGRGVRVMAIPCPGLVEFVERGEVDSPELDTLLAKLLTPALNAEVDTIVLGCTHYPFVQRRIEALGAGQWRVIEPSEAVARQVERLAVGAGGEIVAKGGLGDLVNAGQPTRSPISLLTTGDPNLVGPVASKLLERRLPAAAVSIT